MSTQKIIITLLVAFVLVTYQNIFDVAHLARNIAFPQSQPQLQTQLDLQGMYGDFGVGPMQASRQQWEISSRIIADTESPNRAFVLVRVKLLPGWCIYSVTQQPGGPMPTKIQLAPSDTFRQIGHFVPTIKHISKATKDFPVPQEMHTESVTWVAPIEMLNGVKENLTVKGELSGQVCELDDQGQALVCVPMGDTFNAGFDANIEGIAAIILNARQTAKELGIKWPEANEAASDLTITPPTTVLGSQIAVAELKPKEMVGVPGIWTALFYSFVGGLILNIMPCVLPVIGLKILSFFEQAGHNRTKAFLLNLWYSFGIIAVFLVLASLSVGLSTMFTYSLFGIVMCCVVFAMALSLMEVWELRAPVFLGTGKSQELMRKEGAVGAFCKGIITTLLAIPCGAPLLSSALTWADAQTRSGNTSTVFLAYAVIGFGMAFPYLIIGAFPELIRFLPKPGPWMDTFKKIMGFILLAAVVWILYFLPLEMAVPTIALLFAVWFGCWYIGRLPFTAKTDERLTAWVTALAVFGMVLIVSFSVTRNPLTLQNAMQNKLDKWGEKNIERLMSKKHWASFNMQRFEKELAAGHVVIIDFTADWCVTCKVLERTVLHDEKVLEAIDAKKIVTLQADWTDRDPEITALLQQLGGEQVPVVAIFDPKNPKQPIVLRGTFRTETFLEQLKSF